jgi:hypothetical protein
VQKHVPPATEQLQPSRAPPRREIATPAVPPQPVRPSKGDPPSKAVANESSLRATAAAHHPSRTNTPKAKKTATTTNTTRTASTHKQQQQPRKSVPKRGKASVVCGCFGTQHKVLANCLWYVHDLRTYGGGLDTNVSDSEIYILPYLLTSLTHTHTHTPSLRLDPWSDRYCLCLLATQQLRTHFLSTRGLRLLSLLRNFGGSTSHAWWWGSRVRERCGLATQGTIVTL